MSTQTISKTKTADPQASSKRRRHPHKPLSFNAATLRAIVLLGVLIVAIVALLSKTSDPGVWYFLTSMAVNAALTSGRSDSPAPTVTPKSSR